MRTHDRKWPLLLLPLAALVLLGFVTAVGRMGDNADAEGKLRLEETLRRTAVACYAAEGCYPPSVAYMQEHYGIEYDETQYMVIYDAFASNLMPDITVLEHHNEDE